MDISELHELLQRARERKRPLWESAGAVRLLNAGASGTPRLVLEQYGKHAVAYDYGTDLGRPLRMAAPRWLEYFAWDSLSTVDRAAAGEGERGGSRALAGMPPKETVLEEGPLRFRLEPRHPRNVGLFLDTRDLRTWLRENTRGCRVLNLFSYTCSLGMAALWGEALEVVNVDLSQRYLDWGRANLSVNGLPAEKCRFVRMEAERYLDWAAKKGRVFDQVILDPPVFSRFDGKVFRFEDDYFRLAAKAVTLLAPGGTLHAVTNYFEIAPADFKRRLRESVFSAARRVRDLRRVPLPPDFDIPPDSGAREEGNAMIFQVETAPL